MKRTIMMLLLLSVCLLSGCCLSHDWQEATCLTPKTCAECEKTEGEALGHSWAEATCSAPKTCTLCGLTEGEALNHDVQAMGVTQEGFKSACPRCGELPEGPVDWDVYGEAWLLGTWDALQYKKSFNPVEAPAGDQITFHEDGTLEAVLNSETYEGTWSYEQFGGEGIFSAVYYVVSIMDGDYRGFVIVGLTPDVFTISVDDMMIDFER